MHYLANDPGIEYILVIKVLIPRGGGSGHVHYLANVPKKCSCLVISKNAMQVPM